MEKRKQNHSAYDYAVRGNSINFLNTHLLSGRRLDGHDVDVICSIGSQDSSRIKILNKGHFNEEEENAQKSISPSRETYSSNLVNLNIQTNAGNPLGHPKAKPKVNEARSQSKDINKFAQRKGSADSRKSRGGSQGRSDSQKRPGGKSNSNSQSRSSKVLGGSDKQGAGATQAVNQTKSSSLRRPNSAKNLKSQASTQHFTQQPKQMITSPTMAVLQRDPSQQVLPPKPKPLRNQTFSKLPGVMYQSVQSHPLKGSQFSSTGSLSQFATSQQTYMQPQTSLKRAPSASTERKSISTTSKPQTLITSYEGLAFSPQRKKDLNPTQPTSNQKTGSKGGKGSKSKKRSSAQKKHGPRQQQNTLYANEMQNLQNLSPNLGRVQAADLVINEENKEDSFDCMRQSRENPPLQSLDASEIKPKLQSQNPNENQEQSQELSLSFKMQAKGKVKGGMTIGGPTLTNQNALTADIFKSIKQQIQNVNQNQEQRKKRKLQEKKEVEKKYTVPHTVEETSQHQTDKAKRVDIEQMKLMMQKKIQGASQRLSKKKQQPLAQTLAQREMEMLKQKKIESREQWQKEREERHEYQEIVKDTLKQVIPNANSASLTRKRDQSKSQQRPFSAKATLGEQNQQLLVKVPPVTLLDSQNQHMYDPVFVQSVPAKTEASPLRDQTKDKTSDKFNIIGSTLSGTVVSDQLQKAMAAQAPLAGAGDGANYQNPLINNYVKKQRQERSKKRKIEEYQEFLNQKKKDFNMKILKEQYTKNLESFKQNLFSQTKKIKKQKKLHKPAQEPNAIPSGPTSNSETLKRVPRSKSKRRVDDEKENRRQSQSPSKQQVHQQTASQQQHLSKSGTKSRSEKKKKRKLAQATSLAQLKQMQLNVMEMMAQTEEGKHRSKLNIVSKQQKCFKSQTLQDLHQHLPGGLPPTSGKNQIILSKSQIKDFINRKFSSKNSQSISHNDETSSHHNEMSFNQLQQLHMGMSQDRADSRKNPLQTSQQEGLRHMMESQEYRHMFLSEQHQELTPIVGQKDRNALANLHSNAFGAKPTESLKSFQLGHPISSSSVSQSREDLPQYRSQNHDEVNIGEGIHSSAPHQQPHMIDVIAQLQSQQQYEHQQDYRPQSQLQEQRSQLRSRSGSIEESSRAKKGVKPQQSSVRTSLKNPLVPFSPSKEHNEEQISKSKQVSNQKSKKKSVTRKSSAGYKRNQMPPLTSGLQTVKNLNKDHQQLPAHITQQQLQAVLQRPRSASNQKLNLIETIQLQQQTLKIQQERVLLELVQECTTKIQKYLRGYLAKKRVDELKVQQDMKLVQDKYWSSKRNEEGHGKDQDNINISPIKQLHSGHEIPLPTQHQINFNKNINILDEDEENEESKGGDQVEQRSSAASMEGLGSKLSKSESNFKLLMLQEAAAAAEKVAKGQRPQSSDINKKKQSLNKIIRNQHNQLHSHKSSESGGSSKILKIQQKVDEKIEHQKKVSQKHEEEIRHIKGFIEGGNNSSSQQDVSSQLLPKGGEGNHQQQKKQVQDYLVMTKKNLKEQFESLSSSNKLSKDIELEQQLQATTTNRDEEQKKDSFLKNVVHDPKKGLRLPIAKQVNRNYSSTKKDINNSVNLDLQGTSHMLASEERDKSWQFDRKSFQEFFDYNPHRNKDEFLKRNGQDSAQKSKFYNKMSQYEEVLSIMTKKAEKKKEELKKLQDKKHLSPASKKRKDRLEKWVTKQEEDINIKKKWINENVNEMITKIDQELKITKQKIGSGRKQGSFRFNQSLELSQHDISIAHFVSSSIHSTPRTFQQMIDASCGGGSSIHSQRMAHQNFEHSSAALGDSSKQLPQKKLFEYKVPLRQPEKPMALKAETVPPISQTTKKETVVSEKVDDNFPSTIKKDHKVSIISDLDKEVLSKSLSSPENYEQQQQQQQNTSSNNIFQHNLAEESSQILKSKSLGPNEKHIHESDLKYKESDMFNSSERNEDDEEAESLSKMEPPQFQSPILSVTSPQQQVREEEYNEEVEKQMPMHPPTFMTTFEAKLLSQADEKEFRISPISPNSNLEESAQKTDAADQPLHRFGEESKEEHEQLADAFLALKEPEQPLTFDQAKVLREQKQETEVQTEILTDYILALLMDQLGGNLFPKRPIIPMKSPSKDNQSSPISQGSSPSETQQLEDSKDNEIMEEQIPVSEIRSDSKSLTVTAVLPSAAQMPDILEPPKRKKIRGIKTTMRIVDQYTQQIFGKVHDQEDEFVENLSTPLNKDPLEILLHLQNVYVDSDLENAMAFQQSVLPVDLYLDLERNKLNLQMADPSEENDEPANRSMLGEWENIHNKVIFDAINEALDNYRPYGLRGPPMPWSQQTRTLTYKNGQQIESVLRQVRVKVNEWARTFAGALPCSELLAEYGIKGPLDDDKLNLLREERLALVLAAEIEENEMLWTDYEYEETQTKLDVADMILEFLAEEAAKDLNRIQESRHGTSSSKDHEESTKQESLQGSTINKTDLD